MGVLTDIVVADRADARRVCQSNCPSRDFGGLDAKGIDTVKLGALYAVLTAGASDPGFMSRPAASAGEDGPWVVEVPPDMVRLFAGLEAGRLREVGAAWAATEEFSPKYANWPADAVQRVLSDLAALCKRAIAEGKAVFVWMCL